MSMRGKELDAAKDIQMEKIRAAMQDKADGGSKGSASKPDNGSKEGSGAVKDDRS
jgi:hypothetical protein